MHCRDTCVWKCLPPLHSYQPFVSCLFVIHCARLYINNLHLFALLIQACQWMYTRALSVSGRSRTVPVFTAASRTCTSTMSSRTLPRPRWSPAWYRAASPARRSTASMASASLMGSRDQCATASQAGAGRTVTSLLPTPARAASMSANATEFISYTAKMILHTVCPFKEQWWN